jgi:structure-specific endonuclease subunit SLX1
MWAVYCIATVEKPTKTYIGATVDLDRRLAQHNGLLKGGAKATSGRPSEWYRICAVQGFKDNHEALSFEWHWKHFTRKSLEITDPLKRRQAALDKCLEWGSARGMVLDVCY